MKKLKTINIFFYCLKGQRTLLLLGMNSSVSNTESIVKIGNKDKNGLVFYSQTITFIFILYGRDI